MYKIGEKLVTTQVIGKENTDIFLNKGDTVEFVKVIDTDDLTKSYVCVKLDNGKSITIPELSVVKQDKSIYKKELKSYNILLMKDNPRLRIYHHNILLRYFFRIYYYFIKDKKKIDLSSVKNIIKENTNV